MNKKTEEILSGFFVSMIILVVLYISASLVCWDVRIGKWNVWIRFIFVVFSIAALADIYVHIKENIMKVDRGIEPKDTLYEICNDTTTVTHNISDLFTEKVNQITKKK